MFSILMLSGFFMSLLFTGYNALAFVDVERSTMNAATSFYATFQQLSLSLGICLAASLLHTADKLLGVDRAGLSPFALAFLGITGISCLATLQIIRLAPDVGRFALDTESRRSLIVHDDDQMASSSRRWMVLDGHSSALPSATREARSGFGDRHPLTPSALRKRPS